MPGAVGGKAFGEEVGEATRLVEVLAVRERPVAELDGDTIAVLDGVAAQQRGRVGRNERCLSGRGHRARLQT